MSIDFFASYFASRRWLRWTAIAAGTFVLLTALAWLAAPPIARAQLESRISEALGRQTTVESVAFNPLQLRFTVRKLVIADPAGTTPLLALDELIADLSSASVWRWAPVLDALKLVHPAVSLGRERDGRYSVQDLIDAVLAGSSGPTPRFSVNNIEIDDGSIAFDDGTTGRKHRVEKLAIGIPFLSSLPYKTATRGRRASRALSTARTSSWAATPSRSPNGARPRSTSTSTPCRSRITSRTCPSSHG